MGRHSRRRQLGLHRHLDQRCENPNNLTSFGSANSGSASAAWVLNGGRIINGNNTSPTISLGSLSGTGGILSNNTLGQVTYSVGGLNTDATFSGQIVNQWGGGGTTAITKVGSGIWTLSGNLSYSGATVINGGNLVIQTGLNYAAPADLRLRARQQLQTHVLQHEQPDHRQGHHRQRRSLHRR